MEKIRSICGKALLLFLCTVLLLLTGCGASEEPKENPLYSIELTDENSMEITLVNASGYPVKEFNTWRPGEQDGFDLLHNLDRDLEQDEIMTVRILRCEGNTYSYLAEGTKESGSSYFYGDGYKEFPEGGIVVLLPKERYDVEIQTIFEAGTDAETAKETALSQYQAACDAELEAKRAEEKAAEEEAKRRAEEKRLEKEKWERLANLSQEEIDAAVKSLGYKSLEQMRTKKNNDIRFNNYADEYERQKHEAFYELYGYWYPNGDRNSLKYIGITNQEFMWYQFDPEQGDVQLGKLRLLASSGGVYRITFTLADNNKFTVEYEHLLQDLSEGKLTFENCDKQYSNNVEYYYSKR